MSTAQDFQDQLKSRHRWGRLFEAVCLGATMFGLVVLAVLLTGLIWKSWGWINTDFLTSYPSPQPEESGMIAGLWGSFWLLLLTAVITVPIGVGAAIYLEEYSAKNRLTTFIQLNISNLAGVPSIVYGILGLSVFVRMFDAFQGEHEKVLQIAMGFATLEIPLPFGKTLISGALTLSLLILPVVIIASQEALRSVPPSLRHAALALGASEWQTIRHQVLPASIPGIATGVILALSRAIGETAPILVVGAAGYITQSPGRIESIADIISHPGQLLEVPFYKYSCMPMQIYYWVGLAKAEFQNVAAAGIVVLLVVLLLMNFTAVYIRQRFRGKIQW